MHKHITSFKQTPPQKFTKYTSIFKNPKKFSESQNQGLNEWNEWRMKNEEKRDHTKWEMITLGRNPHGFEV